MENLNFYLKKLSSKVCILFFFAVIVEFSTASAQQPSTLETIISSLEKGSITQLSAAFSQNIEIVVGDKELNCTAKEATVFLNDYFSTNKITHFQANHKGSRDSANFIIGTLTTDNGLFRIFLLIRGKQALIQQIRIEKYD
jgi:hypothetical protein